MSSNTATHKLYHFKYSICSIMVRYTYALRGEPTTTEDVRIEEEDVNIMVGEQFTEHFLCDINAAGEVPVLAPIDGKATIPDSLDITRFLSKSYPGLIPSSKYEEILDMLKRLHAINFFSLTFAGKPEAQEKAKAQLQQILNPDISPRYREAIGNKIRRLETTKLAALEHDYSKANELDAKNLMLELDKILRESPTGLCFDFEKPTALDAHLVVFITRMQEIGRDDLLSPGLIQYASRLMEGQEWKAVMQGRRTVPPR